MERVQDRFFRLLEAAAADVDLDLVVEFSHANLGTLYLQSRESFETAVAAPFNFQTGSVTIGSYEAVHERLPMLFPERTNPYMAQFDPVHLDRAIEAIVAYAKEHQP